MRARAARRVGRGLSAVRDAQRRHHRGHHPDGSRRAAPASSFSGCTAWARACIARCRHGSGRRAACTLRSARYRDLLAYLVRRLLENGANSSFVHQLADEHVAMDRAGALAAAGRAAAGLPLPRDLYGTGRPNSAGLDVTPRTRAHRRSPTRGGARVPVLPNVRRRSAASPLTAGASSWRSCQQAARWLERAGGGRCATDARSCGPHRDAALRVRRARRERRPQDLGRRDLRSARGRSIFCATTPTKPSGSWRPCRCRGRRRESNELRLRARGVWVCIVAWNFPLAIFTGQIAAALVTGNAVRRSRRNRRRRARKRWSNCCTGAACPSDALR